jgi:hypothetical protein
MDVRVNASPLRVGFAPLSFFERAAGLLQVYCDAAQIGLRITDSQGGRVSLSQPEHRGRHGLLLHMFSSACGMIPFLRHDHKVQVLLPHGLFRKAK